MCSDQFSLLKSLDQIQYANLTGEIRISKHRQSSEDSCQSPVELWGCQNIHKTDTSWALESNQCFIFFFFSVSFTKVRWLWETFDCKAILQSNRNPTKSSCRKRLQILTGPQTLHLYSEESKRCSLSALGIF